MTSTFSVICCIYPCNPHAKRIIVASDSLLNAVKARQLRLRQSEELDASDNSETSTNS